MGRLEVEAESEVEAEVKVDVTVDIEVKGRSPASSVSSNLESRSSNPFQLRPTFRKSRATRSYHPLRCPICPSNHPTLEQPHEPLQPSPGLISNNPKKKKKRKSNSDSRLLKQSPQTPLPPPLHNQITTHPHQPRLSPF